MGMARPIDPKVTPYTRADGSTVFRVRIRVNGRQTTETFDSDAAAQVFRLQCMDPAIGPARAVARRAREDALSDDYVPTVAEMLEIHLKQLTGIQDTTREGYRDEARRSWLPRFGSFRVDELSRDDVADWLNDAAGTVSPKTIKNAQSVLSATMKTAVAREYIRVNPALGLRVTRDGEEDADDIKFLTHAEFDLLYAQIPEFYQPFIVTLFGTGMRYSEATALPQRLVDMDAGHWTGDTFTAQPLTKVRQAWKKSGRLGPPKSPKSRRDIGIGLEVAEVIEPLLARPKDQPIFTTPGGDRLRSQNFFTRIWKPATVRASICSDHIEPGCRCAGAKPHLCLVHTKKDAKGVHIMPPPCGCAGTLPFRPRIHDARHTHASWLIAAGVPLPVVQARLGHEKITTTMDVYGHLLPDVQLEAARAASLAFSRTSLGANRPIPQLG